MGLWHGDARCLLLKVPGVSFAVMVYGMLWGIVEKREPLETTGKEKGRAQSREK